jgi:predicted AAA+ superfamily ATPase
MIKRRLEKIVQQALKENASVALLGPRQVGKTTLAIGLLKKERGTYIDLEDSVDRRKMDDFPAYYAEDMNELLILDEIQKLPEVFASIRGIIEKQRRAGNRTGLFLFLGSASMELLRQSGESLAGRIACLELNPIDLLEFNGEQNQLWLRGGFPESILAATDKQSLSWRKNFIRTYLERDIQQIGAKIPSETLERFWTMLAHQQGSMINMSALARGIDVSVTTANRYLDLMVDMLLVRRLKPYSFNIGKRLVKSPKIYVRDSGIAHALLNIGHFSDLIGHPVCGGSWEGFVIENLLSVCPAHVNFYYYRTAQGAEIDLIIEVNHAELWAIEIKRSLTPTVSKGFHIACADINAKKRYVIYQGNDSFPLGEGLKAMPLKNMMKELMELGK